MHVLGGMQRNTYIYHLADLTAPHARTVDRVFTGDFALVGGHSTNCAFFHFDVGDLNIFNNFGAAHFGPFGQSPGCLNRIRNTIPGKIKSGNQIIRAHTGY